jgi:hypothetical protein
MRELTSVRSNLRPINDVWTRAVLCCYFKYVIQIMGLFLHGTVRVARAPRQPPLASRELKEAVIDKISLCAVMLCTVVYSMLVQSYRRALQDGRDITSCTV